MHNYLWKYKHIDKHEIQSISSEFSVPQSIATIMSIKSITDKKISKEFFYENIESLNDPLLMKDMQKAVDRVILAKSSNELILIIGDYDADGTSATSILYLFLKSINVDVEYFIPNRQTDGYGVSKKAIDFGQKIGAKLIITCDCGITAVDEVKYAQKLNIDTIITDHHKQAAILPDAYAILNPNQLLCEYPFKGLCGAGVAFKLCQEINNQLGYGIENIMCYSDLVSIATTADIVPLIDENRFIVKQGLKDIKKGRNKGIKALLKVSKLEPESLTVGQLGFWFIPKINAAGRIGDAARAVKLFTSKNPIFANEIAIDLENENEKRKKITQSHENEAQSIINNKIDYKVNKILIIYKDDWHFGVLGIVASRIKESYNRPTIVLSKEGDFYKGSCRSIAGFDIVDALANSSDLLENYGGHPMAAGLTITKNNLSNFISKITAYSNDMLKDNIQPIINIDYEIKLSEINNRFIKFLEHLEPFGPGNSKPIFCTKKIKNISNVLLIGKDKETLKFTVHGSEINFDVIGFRMIENYEKVISGKSIDIAYSIDKNIWRNKVSIQLVLKDIVYSDA